jgi:hypothetical protein
MKMGLNIQTLAVSETSTLHLKDAEGNLLYADGPAGADGKPSKLPVQVTVFGPGSREYAQVAARKSNRTFARLRKKGKIDQSADEITEERAADLAAKTLSFENLDVEEGVPATTRDHFRQIYADLSLGFIADQVSEYLDEWENFRKRSATS